MLCKNFIQSSVIYSRFSILKVARFALLFRKKTLEKIDDKDQKRYQPNHLFRQFQIYRVIMIREHSNKRNKFSFKCGTDCSR
jgi:hypothetical protein